MLVGALARGLSAVSWDELAVERKLSWREWLSGSGATEGWSAFRDQLEPLVRSASRDEALQPERLTPGRIATELNSVMSGAQAPAWFLNRATPEVRGMLERAQTDARRGQFGFGSVDAADIAAGLCLFLGADLWDPLVAFLTDPLLPRSFKASATDRLASASDQIPESAVADITTHAEGLLAGGSLPFLFEGPDIEPFPAAIRLLGATNAWSSPQLVVSLARLASGDERSRLEASRTVTSLVQSRPIVPEWLVFAAMQLSADLNANVRAESGRSLALAIGRVEFASELMAGRLQELLDEDGILVPLLVLRGLAGDVKDMPPTVLAQVEQLAETHMIHGVREQARYLLNARRLLEIPGG